MHFFKIFNLDKTFFNGRQSNNLKFKVQKLNNGIFLRNNFQASHPFYKYLKAWKSLSYMFSANDQNK